MRASSILLAERGSVRTTFCRLPRKVKQSSRTYKKCKPFVFQKPWLSTCRYAYDDTRTTQFETFVLSHASAEDDIRKLLILIAEEQKLLLVRPFLDSPRYFFPSNAANQPMPHVKHRT